MSKVLVTGGAGFIGSNLSRMLLDEGNEVILYDNLSSGYRENVQALPGAKFIEGDIRNASLLTEVMRDTDTVFHLAASVGNARSIAYPIEDSEINVIGTLQVLEAARAQDVRKIVFSSSAGIFGELKSLPIREDHPVEPNSPYGASKLAAEKMCLAYAQLYQLEAVCLRYFNVYGINQRYDAYGSVIPIFAHRLLRGEALTVFGNGEQTRDFINVRDVAKANLQASQTRSVSGAFNIASGSAITVNRLIEVMSAAGEISPAVEYGPLRSGDVRHSRADVSAAREAFGFQPSVKLEEGLSEYMRWSKSAAASQHCAPLGL